MSFLSQDVPSLGPFTGREESVIDNNPAVAGTNPSQSKVALYKLSLVMTVLLNSLNKTMVAGTIYYAQFGIGDLTSFDPDTGLPATTQSVQSYLLTGINIPVGTTGGTDTWYTGIYTSAGVLVGSSTVGTTAGTASMIQQIPFDNGTTATPVTVTSGTYLLALQSSGTTATFKSINSPIWPAFTGSQTGAAGTLAKITSVAATYTANLAPLLSVY